MDYGYEGEMLKILVRESLSIFDLAAKACDIVIPRPIPL